MSETGDWPLGAIHRLDAYLDEHPEARASLIAEEARRREPAATVRAWAWTLKWLRTQGGSVLAAQVVSVMESRLRQELAK